MGRAVTTHRTNDAMNARNCNLLLHLRQRRIEGGVDFRQETVVETVLSALQRHDSHVSMKSDVYATMVT